MQEFYKIMDSGMKVETHRGLMNAAVAGCLCRSIKSRVCERRLSPSIAATPLALPHFGLDREFHRPMRPDHLVIQDV